MRGDQHRGKQVAVLLGGLSAEREISLMSGGRMAAVLRERGHRVTEVDPGRDVANQLREAGAEVVVIALHGTYGEDGCIQGLLETMGLPYTGSPPLASALCMDKVLSKRVLVECGIPTPRYVALEDEAARAAYDGSELALPQVVKPAADGSSVGVSLVRDPGDLAGAVAEAASYGDGRVLCEELVPGSEVSVGVLDGRALGSVEIVPATEFYDYEAKYFRDDTQYHCPARLDPAVIERLHEVAARTHAILGCRGATRVDFMVPADGRAQVIELNTLPGLTDHSLLPMAAGLQGMGFADLVEEILDRASLWHTARPAPERSES
jgi:D-alanine-D-alanine ligase